MANDHISEQPPVRSEGDFNNQFQTAGDGGIGLISLVESGEGTMVKALQNFQEAEISMVPGMDDVNTRKLGFSIAKAEGDGSLNFAATAAGADAIMRPKKGDVGEPAKDTAMGMFALDGKYKMQHASSAA